MQAGGFCVVLELRAEDMHTLFAAQPAMRESADAVLHDWLRATSSDALRRSWLLGRVPVPTLELLGSRFSVSAVSEGALLLEEGIDSTVEEST